jgi:hypothetical protein
MSIISLTDTILLFTGALNLWIFAAFEWSIMTTSTIVCKLSPFLIYTALDYSISLIVLLTAEKLYAISKPLQANQNKENIKKTLLFAFLSLGLCAAVNSHFLFSQSLNVIKIDNSMNKTSDTIKMCTNDIWWAKFYDYYWPYIDATIYSFLPFLLITVFNALIIKGLLKEAKKSCKLQKRFRSREDLNKAASSPALIKKNKIFKINCNQEAEFHSPIRRVAIVEFNSKNLFTQISLAIKHVNRVNKSDPKRITRVIFMINISFFLLTMPIVVLQIVNQAYINTKIKNLTTLDQEKRSDIIDKDEISQEHLFDLLKALFEFLQYLNHSINFFLYCFSGQTFRTETKNFILSFRKILNFCKE